MTAVDRRKGLAGLLQWGAYLAASTLLGLLWYPVAIFADAIPVYLYGGEATPDKTISHPWILIVGLISGLLFRGITVMRDKEPSAWLALFFPFIGVVSKAIVDFPLSQTPTNIEPLPFLLIGSIIAYVFGGWLVIPLAVPYLYVLRRVHRFFERWALNAPRRRVRHVTWGVACIGFIGATEVPKLAEYWKEEVAYRKELEFKRLISGFGLTLPPGTKFVGSGEAPGGFDSVPSYWFHRKGHFDWPLVADSQPLASPEDAIEIEWRSVRAKVREGKVSDFDQKKWYVDGQTIQATLIRAKEGDYLEVIPW